LELKGSERFTIIHSVFENTLPGNFCPILALWKYVNKVSRTRKYTNVHSY